MYYLDVYVCNQAVLKFHSLLGDYIDITGRNCKITNSLEGISINDEFRDFLLIFNPKYLNLLLSTILCLLLLMII